MLNKFILIYFEIRAFYEVMWKYMLERTATDNNMARPHRLLSKKSYRHTIGI
jgi:hypothetical protein